MTAPTAVPRHTIVRYRPRSLGFYAGWAPVEVLRWRLFVDETHEAVRGEKGGAHWDHDWACESLSTHPDGSTSWTCNGRNEWPSLEAALAAIDKDREYPVYPTYEEALARALEVATVAMERALRRLREVRWNVTQIQDAMSRPTPELPS